MRLTVDSQNHCVVLDDDILSTLHTSTNSTQLDVGTYVVRIERGSLRDDSLRDDSDGQLISGEPWVLLWIHGGKFINQKTNANVGATWSSLNGYDDTLTLEVLEPTILCGLFFNTDGGHYSGEIRLSVLKDF